MRTVMDRRIFLALATACSLAAPVAKAEAIQPEWQKVIDAAKAEGSVTIYSGQGLSQLQELARRFEAAYGIKVEIVRGVETDFAPKVEAEARTGNGIADIMVQTSAIILEDMEAKGYFVPVIGPEFDRPDYDRAKRAPHNTAFEVNAALLTYSWNTELLPEGMKDYDDIFKPELEGLIGLSAPSSSTQVDYYFYLEELFGADFLDKVAQLKPRIYPGALPMAQALSSGEVAVILYGEPQIDQKAKGAPVESGLNPTPWGGRFYGTVLKSAPHPNAAQLLANFLITQEGQEAVARKGASIAEGTEGALMQIDQVRRPDLSKLTPDSVRAFQARFSALFGNS